MLPRLKLLRRESTTSCSARSGPNASTAYSRILRNWIIYLDMSGLMARKQHRPFEQPGITAGTQPLPREGGMFLTTEDGRRPHATVGTPGRTQGRARLGHPGTGSDTARGGVGR